MSNENAKVQKLVPRGRLWGPCATGSVEDLVERVLNDDQTEELLRRYAVGEIDRHELAYCLELSFESIEERILNAEREEGRAAISANNDDDYEEHA